MKKILFIIGLFVSLASTAQVKQRMGTYGISSRRIQPDSAFRIPTVRVGIRDQNLGYDTAQVYYNKPDSSIKVWTGSQWIVIGGGGSGSVTNVSALTIGTSGTDITSSVANATTTPVITLNVPTASASNRGALSAADWIAFNAKPTGSGATNQVAYWSSATALTGLGLNTGAMRVLTQTSSGAPVWTLPTSLPGSISSLTTKGFETSYYNSTTGVLNIPKDQRVGIYLELGKTFVRRKPYLLGNALIGFGNSWISGAFSGGTPYMTQLGTYYGKSVYVGTLSAANGSDINTIINLAYAWGTFGNDTTTFVDVAMIPAVGLGTSGQPYAGVYFNDHPNAPLLTKTKNYIYGTYKAFIANHYLDNDFFSVASLADANFRNAVASDSLGAKSTTGAIGLGAFSFTKPAGKTSLVIGTYGADSTRVRQGTITVALAGNTIFSKYFNGLNDANRGTSLTIKCGLNYEAIVLQNLPDSAATVTVTCSGDSTRFDYIGYLKTKEKAVRPLYINNIGYGSGQSQFVIPISYIDSANQMLQDAVRDFTDYPVFIQNTNNWLDSSIHVNNPTSFHLTAAGNDSVAKAYIANLIPLSYTPVNNAAWTTSGSTSNYYGSVKIVDGTQGASKVFTSDANGLGSWTTPSGGSLTVGTTAIASGTSTRVLYDNAGVLGEDADFTFDGTRVTATGVRVGNGTLAAPSHSFTNTTGTGLYYDGTYYAEAMGGVPIRNTFVSGGGSGFVQMDFSGPSTATLGDGKSYTSFVGGDSYSTSGIFEAGAASLIANNGLANGLNIGTIAAAGVIDFWTTGSIRMTIASAGGVTAAVSVTSPSIISTGTMTLKGYTVATLPAGTVGMTAYVTDALAPTFLATVVGGGAIVTPVFYNGTNWVGY